MFWVEVTNTDGCSSNDTVYLNFASIPEVNLGADTAVCGDVSITLDAGNPGSTYLWSNGLTSQTITADTLGIGYGVHNYSVEVTTEFDCVNSGDISIEFVNCTGIDEQASIELRVYPNPAQGIFNIEINSETNNPVNIKVINVAGSIIYNLNNIVVSGTHIEKVDLSNYSDGNYTIIVTNEGVSTTRKIVLRK
jgi:hypothetical protein